MGTTLDYLNQLEREFHAGKVHLHESETEWTATHDTPRGPRLVARWVKAQQSPARLAQLRALAATEPRPA